ncbi:tyrosine-type recombinase/integrase [Campylobacter estrildidarum]|uniref:Integrase n=1 Tax=Campylobacter estrildidarum TaxID=2510189 RepID=A0A4U7BDM0_9BACT|nr:site-specific integrase [Campylobacter estrildidarum]TKX28021.1 integrase [Campylobacter estrildidarum]
MLNDTKIKALKAKDKKYYIADFDNLLLCVYPSGKKTFMFNYKCPKTLKYKRITLGEYPTLSLANARSQRDKLKINLIDNESIHEKTDITFKHLALEKMELKKLELSEKTYKSYMSYLQRFAFGIYGDIILDKLQIKDILKSFEKFRKENIKEGADKFFTLLNEIFRYGVMKEYIKNNPIVNLNRKDLLINKASKNHATILEIKEIKTLVNDIVNYKGFINVKIAAMFSLLTAQRSFSIRSSKWEDIDLENGMWYIPQEDMKMRRAHTIPLNSQCVYMLKKYKEMSVDTGYLFYSLRSKSEIISDNTIRSMFRRMGYSNDDFTPHGFRAMFSTLAHENRDKHRMSSDIIELCLAHVEKNKIKSAYNHALNLKEKTILMQWWGDYLNEIADLNQQVQNIFL